MIDPEDKSGTNEAGIEPETTPDPPKRKFNRTKPLDAPEDEAIAQYLATPKSIRQFKSFSELAEHFNISRMTVYRRSKDLRVLKRVESLIRLYKLAGDLVARRNWPRIVAGQVKAAVSGNTKAAQFCKEQAWPEEDPARGDFC
jgi:DeoR/GlpR family transcriptional regulator of sugar metabolism